MNIANIGRIEILYETVNFFLNSSYKIPLIITSKQCHLNKKV